MPRAAQSSASVPAMSSECCTPSAWQGPEISANGRLLATRTDPMAMVSNVPVVMDASSGAGCSAPR